ncbi:MAG: TlpA disulfide reductase family protein [Candidatus Sumerlaeota bacterium]
MRKSSILKNIFCSLAISGGAIGLPLVAAAAPPAPTPEIDRSFTTGKGASLPDELEAPVLKEMEKRHPGEKPKAILVQLINCDSQLCAESLKNIQEFIYADLADENVVVIAIAVNSTEAEVLKLTGPAKVTFPVIADKEKMMFAKFAADGVPRTVIADGDGKIVYTNSGYTPGREAEYRAVIDALLSDGKIPPGLGDSSSEPQADRELMARDVRGQQAPEVPVETWINPLPADVAGKYKLVDFWATWCGPCRGALEYSETIHGQFEDKLVTMAVSDEPAAVVEEYVKGAKLKQPIGVDTKKRASDFLQIQGIPHAILINPQGKVVWQGHPMELWGDNGKKMREALDGKEFIPAKNQAKEAVKKTPEGAEKPQ